MDKEFILKEYDRIVKGNPGIPLGERRFCKEIGIKQYDWKKYWARFGDLIQEAGHVRNQLQAAYNEDFLIGKLIELINKIRRYPSPADFLVERDKIQSLPDYGTFLHRGDKQYWASKVVEYCSIRGGNEYASEVCSPLCNGGMKQKVPNVHVEIVGYVYLMKSGKYYKIGRSNSVGRREYELAIQLPEKLKTLHAIQTYDPAGIEAYWHRRFEAKRLRKGAEWFDLDDADIRAFRRNKFMWG